MALFEIFLAILKGLPWTVSLTLLSFILGAVLAIPLCALRISKSYFLRTSSGLIILTFRSIPPIVWLFFIFFGVSQHLITLSPFVAAVAGLGIITAVNMAEIYRGALKAVPYGQYEASAVLGLSTWQKYYDVLVPQVFRYSLPSASTYLIGLLKDTAVASAIGVPEMAQVSGLLSQQTFRGLSIYAFAAIIYFALSFMFAWASRRLESGLKARIER